MDLALPDVPVALAATAAAALAGLQAGAYGLARRGLAAIAAEADATAHVAAPVLLFAAATASAAGTAPTLAPSPSAAIAVAVAAASALAWLRLRRRPSWRVVLASATTARRLDLPAGRIGAAAIALALALLAVAVALGADATVAVPGWAPLVASFGLRPRLAVTAAGLAGAGEVACARFAAAPELAPLAGLGVVTVAVVVLLWTAPDGALERTP